MSLSYEEKKERVKMKKRKWEKAKESTMYCK